VTFLAAGDTTRWAAGIGELGGRYRRREVILVWLRIRSGITVAGRWLAGRQEGVSTTEYALLLALVVIVLITTLGTLGDALKAKLDGIIAQLTGAGH
jgi:Flp pilus assembly pilin Flp